MAACVFKDRDVINRKILRKVQLVERLQCRRHNACGNISVCNRRMRLKWPTVFFYEPRANGRNCLCRRIPQRCPRIIGKHMGKQRSIAKSVKMIDMSRKSFAFRERSALDCVRQVRSCAFGRQRKRRNKRYVHGRAVSRLTAVERIHIPAAVFKCER